MRHVKPDPVLQHVTIVMPVYNDWESFARLTQDIEAAFAASDHIVDVVAIDDCSSTEPLMPSLGGCIRSIDVIRLTINVGHQRAIAVGLVHAEEQQATRLVAVMDSDGEDRPVELKRMLEEVARHPATAVVAQRQRRSEGLKFRTFYWFYARMFRLLTGHWIDFGNFSVLPRAHVSRLVHNANIWNNFAASLIQSKVRIHRLPTARGKRYAGQSQMNLVSLISHGLGAISVFSEAVFVRILLVSMTLFAGSVLSAVTVFLIRMFSSLAVPGWTTNVLGFAVLLSVQAVMMPIMIAFLLLNNRSSFQNLPKEYASRLVERSYRLYERPGDLAYEPLRTIASS